MADKKIVKKEVKLFLADPNNTPVDDLQKSEKGESALVKSILNTLHETSEPVQRLGFEVDPAQYNAYASLYRQKYRLIPDYLLKQIAIQDDLVACILNVRCNHISAFGRPQLDRFSTGFKIDPNPGIVNRYDEEQKKDLRQKIAKVTRLFNNCGHTKGWADKDRMTLSQFLWQQARNALVVGRFATEIIHTTDVDGTKKFHSFRPIDGGTIYYAVSYQSGAESVRKQARLLMEQIKNKKLDPEKYVNDEYDYFQVQEGRPLQAFTAEECILWNCFEVTDLELGGYPLTPIDTIVSAVTTHINITTHNKLYFQNGRAAKGMVVIKSDDIDESTIAKVRQQFKAVINNVNNSFITPVFNVGSKDDLQFQVMDASGRDMEFQFLSDSTARTILAAFQISPDEVPGYSHLSRGTNSQALSESNSEFKLEAARDVGIRPLLAQFQDFLNSCIFPLIDPELAKICSIKLVGLDADTAEKESVRLQQDIPVHMTYDEVLHKVEKDLIGRDFGGEFPLNPQYQTVLDKYYSVGQILEKFMGIKGASQNPTLAYHRDPFWFQWQQLQMEQAAMQQQQAMAAAQQSAGGQPPPDGGGGGASPPPAASTPEGGTPGSGDSGKSGPGATISKDPTKDMAEQQQDLSRSIDQLTNLLSKGEGQLPPSKRKLLAQQRATVQKIMSSWKEDSEKALKEILDKLPKK